jgi:hypothetical protein
VLGIPNPFPYALKVKVPFVVSVITLFAAAFRNERPPDLPNALGIKESPSFRQNGASECLSNWDFRKDEEKPFI